MSESPRYAYSSTNGERFVLKWLFCRLLGAIHVFIAVVTTALLVAVPLFGLENDGWREAEHISVANAIFSLAVGGTLIWLSTQTHLNTLIGFVVFLVGAVVYGLATTL